MTKKKRGLLERLFRFQAKPLRILTEEVIKGAKDGIQKEKEERRD